MIETCHQRRTQSQAPLGCPSRSQQITPDAANSTTTVGFIAPRKATQHPRRIDRPSRSSYPRGILIYHLTLGRDISRLRLDTWSDLFRDTLKREVRGTQHGLNGDIIVATAAANTAGYIGNAAIATHNVVFEITRRVVGDRTCQPEAPFVAPIWQDVREAQDPRKRG